MSIGNQFGFGTTFTADYVPSGWEDAPGMPWTVKVRVDEFSKEEDAYHWTIIDGVPEEFLDDIGSGYGFDEFHNAREFTQANI